MPAAEGQSRDFAEFEALFEADPNGVLLVADDGTILSANRTAAEIFRAGVDDLVGMPVEALVPAELRATHADHRSRFVRNGRTQRMGVGLEFTAHRPDGSDFAAEIGISVVAAKAGRLVCVVVTDITERKRAETRVARVKELADALSASLTPEQVAQAAVERCGAIVGALRGSVTLWNDESERLDVVSTFGYPEGARTAESLSSDPSPVTDALLTRSPVVIESAGELRRRYPGTEEPAGADAAYAVVPLAVPGGGVVGTLNLVFPGGTDPAAEMPFIEELARLVAQATDRARLFAAERRARLHADALARVSAALSAASTLQAVAEAVVTEGGAALGAPAAFLVALDRDARRLRLLASAGFPTEVVERWTEMPLDSPVPLAVTAQTGRPIWLETEEDAARWPAGREARAASGYLAAMVAPLLAGGKPIGAVSFNFSGPRRFSASERNLVLALAGLAGHAFERATLYETAERARRTTEAVIDQMPVAVVVAAAPSGRLIFRNAAVERIWGAELPWMDSIGEYVEWRAIHPDASPYSAEDYPLARALRTGTAISDEEMTVKRRDGTAVVVQISAVPVHDDGGEVIAVVATAVDVTERAQAAALQEAFMGILSHELRTPVTSILGGSRLLASRTSTFGEAVRQELVADIAAEAERLHRLVENLLVIARVERGMEFEPGEPVLLQYLVSTALIDAKRRWPDATFELAVEPALPPVQGEPTYVGQILANLLSNAVKYSDVPATLTISLGREGDAVAVRVLDRGVGIDERTAERLFDAYYRAPSSARRAPGAGIGLFVVRRLVDAMKGRTWAKPRADGGSEFGFSLPIVEE